MNDEQLSARLREWAPPPPDFDAGFSVRVRSRLDHETASVPGSRSSVFRLAAAASVLLGVVIGVAGGLHAPAGPSNDQIAADYVRSIDPLQMTAYARHDTAHVHP